MKHPASWQYEEFQQIGKDYGDPAEVEIYDSTQADLRDVEAESNQALDLPALKPCGRVAVARGLFNREQAHARRVIGGYLCTKNAQ